MTDEVLAANAALYDAFESGDVAAMSALWDDTDGVSCVHPGWPALHGRRQVLHSWSALMAGGETTFLVTGATVSVDGDTAVVTCVEDVLTALESGGQAQACVATNVFRRRGDRWRLVVHHASPLLARPS